MRRHSLAARFVTSAAALSSLAGQVQQVLAQQSAVTIIPHFSQTLAFCQITDLSSARSLSSGCSTQGGVPAAVAQTVLCDETASLRWLSTGGLPTTTYGMPLTTGQCVQFIDNPSNLRAIGVSTTAVLDVWFGGK